jgi:hypothetical protein
MQRGTVCVVVAVVLQTSEQAGRAVWYHETYTGDIPNNNGGQHTAQLLTTDCKNDTEQKITATHLPSFHFT